MFHRTRALATILSSAALVGAGAPAAAEAHHGDHGGHHARHWGGRDRGLARTAAQLGVTKDQLKAALKTVADQQRAAAAPPSFKAVAAQQLGVTEDQLKAAFQQAKATAHSKAEFAAAVAGALQTDPARVTAAFDAASAQQKAAWKAKRDAFVNALAQQLGVTPDKVAAAFDSRCGFKHH